jgi:(1->4)-alpha-D-glucan 1-alpha-D-glucosylmutase
MTGSLRRLAAVYGIAADYHDAWGRLHHVPDDVLRALLRAMRVDAASESQIADALAELARAKCRQCLAPMSVVRAGARPWSLRVHLPAQVAQSALEWRVRTEDAAELRHASPAVARVFAPRGEPCVALDVALDVPLPNGYHDIALYANRERVAHGVLAVAPPACYRPVPLRNGGRAWGVALQLYGVRSARNWGIGDFTDLAEVVAQWGAEGADVVGVNPLHALFPHNPAHASPYSPSSRIFQNVLYLDVEAIAEFAHCREARERVASPPFQHALRALREAPLVDYPGVAALKMPVLEMLYAQARADARTANTARWSAFDAFRTMGGEALRRQAIFDALQAHFFARDAAILGWPAWPPEYRDPAAPAITAFADEHADRIDFFAWLQWQADLQRAAVAERARRSGLAIGLYTDLAVSVDRGGAEAWAQQHLYAVSASVGAPPDIFNVAGQDWGLPPMIPQCLRDAAYAPFIATLRANMRSAGALRIDHVMGLLRLYWVPSGATPADGAYVRYPLADLLGLLALESERQQCLVIGEDLGTVPDEVRAALAANDVLSYRVLLFERDAAGNFNAPSQYPEAALATASTHDLPTLAGWWAGHDIALRATHGHLGPQADLDAPMAARIADRGQLLAALDRAGLLPEGTPLDPRAVPALTPALAIALQQFLARTPSALLAVQPEDTFGAIEQANLPGTTTQHPNWRRKLPVALDEVTADGRLHALAQRIAAERPRLRP